MGVLEGRSDPGYDGGVADVELRYGPGGATAVLVGNLKAAAFKQGLKVVVDKRDDQLIDALRLHFSADAGEKLLGKLPKSLRMCFPVFGKRVADLTADLGDGRTVTLRLPKLESRDRYRTLIDAFCLLVHDFFQASDDVARAALLEGAHWDDGIARLDIDDSGDSLRWRDGEIP
ncbi:MAG: hypothetical protein AAF500_00185 [Myxococcota bacterium]